MKEKKLKSNVNGITLIALIITIIVMLILVGVTINIAVNGGLFAKAKEAKRKTQEVMEEEKKWEEGKVQADGKWYNSMQDYLEGKELIIGNWTLSEKGDTVTDGDVTLKIGDYVNYIYDTVEEAYDLPTNISGCDSEQKINQTIDLKWRVLGVDEKGCLTLISEKPTNDTIGLNGAKGYNNGVYILNDICAKQYSNSELGITSRSIKIEDIEKGFSDIGIAERDKYTNLSSLPQYGKTYTYTDTNFLNYPVIYAKENGSGIGITKTDADANKGVKTNGIGGSEAYYNENQLKTKPEGKESMSAGDKEGEQQALTCTQTYYYLNSIPTNYCNNKTFYNMIFETNTCYWLASRSVSCGLSNAYFGLHYVKDSNLNGFYLFYSDGGMYNYSYYLQPVVSLGSNIKVTPCEGVDATGVDEAHMHALNKTE